VGCTSERIAPAGADCSRMILHTTKPPWLPGDLLQNDWASKLRWSSSKNDSRKIWSILAPDLWETIAIMIQIARSLHPICSRFQMIVQRGYTRLEPGSWVRLVRLRLPSVQRHGEKKISDLWWSFGAPLVWPITIRRRQMVSGLVRDDWGWDRLMLKCWRAEKSNREGRLLGFCWKKNEKNRGVLSHRGTPKSSNLNRFSIEIHGDLGSPHFKMDDLS
jgi:hypothetical protein